jgi:hypothetical protein
VESVSNPEYGNALQKLIIPSKLLLVLEMKLKLSPFTFNLALVTLIKEIQTHQNGIQDQQHGS